MLTLQAGAQDATRLPVRLRVPHKTQSVRVVVQMADNERLGTVELDSKTLEAAPAVPTLEPKLVSRPLAQETPAAPILGDRRPSRGRRRKENLGFIGGSGFLAKVFGC